MPERTFTPTQERKKLTYDPQLDLKEWQKLSSLEGQIPPHEYADLQVRWQQEKIVNLETHLGERFNAQLFEVNYPILNGRMVNPFRNEPALETVISGQQEGLKATSAHDQGRELAEVISFSAVESFFLENPQSSNLLIVPSPPGGSYGGNFIDTFNLDDQGQFVRMRRFAISSSLPQHATAIKELTGVSLPQTGRMDVDLKEVVVRTQKSTDEILQFYLPDQKALDLIGYQKLKAIYRPWANKYLQDLMANVPYKNLIDTYNAGLKFADIYMGKDTDSTQTVTGSTSFSARDIPRLVQILGPQSIREVKTGCGASGKIDSIARSLFSSSLLSISDFLRGSESENVVDFQCPGTKKDGTKCTHIIKAYSHETKCPECGEEAICA